MYMIVEVSQYVAVASFSEAWIEIIMALCSYGLKCVASFSEAWIEIKDSYVRRSEEDGRLLLGGVD